METRIRYEDRTVRVVQGTTEEREDLEKSLVAAGRALALPHRLAWTKMDPGKESWLIVVEGPDGEAEYAFALHGTPSRALPGHIILRAERFGIDATAPAWAAGLHGAVDLARQHGRVLRLHVEAHSPDAGDRAAMRAAAMGMGFQPAQASRCYGPTLLIDLERGEDEILAGMHATARRHIRAVGKNPVEVRTIAPGAYEQRMDALLAETMERTGGELQPHDWPAILRLSETHPAISRVVGLFRTDTEGPEALLAYAWGCGHGTHVHYATAASTRRTDLRLPLVYALAWDLIRWAKLNGARYFDFGGVTQGAHGSEDRLGGISDFKRYFSGDDAIVGEEWVLEPSPLKAAAASSASTVATMLRRLRRG